MQKIKNKIAKQLINIPGFRTKRKILLFQSDDWGSQRVPSKETLEYLVKNGINIDNCPYSLNDSLENNDDLCMLLETLQAFRDYKRNHPNFTINNIVCNPDFDKIKRNNFDKYYFEPFTKTLDRLPNRDEVMNLYREGIDNKIFDIQFHGREHVHDKHWIRSLNEKDSLIRELFDHGMFTYYKGENSNCRKEFLDAMGTYNEIQLKTLRKKILEGLDIFEKIWGFRSESVTAPCYIWHREAENYFHDGGVKLIQSGRCQKEPNFKRKKYSIIRRYTGQKNKLNQFYTIRNVMFEPFENNHVDWVSNCLKDINTSFLWSKPAVISTHRVNYIGSINPENRDENLKLLSQLLSQVLKKWPDVEFMSTKNLFELINKT